MKEEIISIVGSKNKESDKFIDVTIEVKTSYRKWSWKHFKYNTISSINKVSGVVQDYGSGLGTGCFRNPATGNVIEIDGRTLLTEIEVLLYMQGLLKWVYFLLL